MLLHRIQTYIPVFCLLLLLAVSAGLAGCGMEQEDRAGLSWRDAMRSAAADMMRLGFERKALALLEESLGNSPAVAEALEVALLYEEKVDEGEAGACLERLFPDLEPTGVKDRIVDFYLKGWRWQQAKGLITHRKSDPRQRALQDILSRTKLIKESFGRTHALNWRIKGWKIENVEDCLSLSSMNHGSISPWKLEFNTKVGWNGEGFRQCMDLKLMGGQDDARLIFGLSASSRPEAGSEDGRDQNILVDYRDGAVQLHSDGPGQEDLRSVRRRGYLPSGVWLSLGIEYIPDCSMLDVFQDPGSGLIKAWIEDKATGRRLMTIGLAPVSVFEEGDMLAGFFSATKGVEEKSEYGGCALYVDNFTFEN